MKNFYTHNFVAFFLTNFYIIFSWKMQPGGRKRAPANNQLLRHNTTTDASSKNLRPGKLSFSNFLYKNKKSLVSVKITANGSYKCQFFFFFVENFCKKLVAETQLDTLFKTHHKARCYVTISIFQRVLATHE